MMTESFLDLENAALVKGGSLGRILVGLEKTKIGEAGAGRVKNVEGAIRTRGRQGSRRRSPLPNGNAG